MLLPVTPLLLVCGRRLALGAWLLLMRDLRGPHLRLALDLLVGLEMLPGSIILSPRRAAIGAWLLMIVQPGTGMGKVCRTRGRQDLRPTAVLEACSSRMPRACSR